MAKTLPLADRSFQKILLRLKRNQTPNGSFANSPGVTAFILLSLSGLKQTPKLKLINERAAQYLINQKGLFQSPLEAVFLWLSALSQYQSEKIDGKILAKAVNLLIKAEVAEGGPYQVNGEVDLAVNLPIAYFLSFQGISLPKLNKFLEDKIKKGDFGSNYYSSPLPVIYLLSRFYRGKNKEKILNYLRRQKRKIRNSLEWSWLILSLMNLGEKINPQDKLLLKKRGPPKSSDQPFLNQPISPLELSVLTAAFSLEAQYKYLNQTSLPSKPETNPQERDLLHGQILSQVKKRISFLPLTLRGEATAWLNSVVEKDQDRQKSLLPYYFWLSLGTGGKQIKKKFLIKLGMANLYGWLAYTIYDNFLDEEGIPPSLPVANMALREMTRIFNSLLPQTNFDQIFQKIMDGIEEANAWETKFARLNHHHSFLLLEKKSLPEWGNYKKLAQRSLGCALGPIAILFRLGYKSDSPKIKQLLGFFEHFLMAKQLNDDAHDWEKDLKLGQATPVVTLLLGQIKIKGKVKISRLLSQLQLIFWRQISVLVCREILRQVKLARKSLKNLLIIQNKENLELLLSPLEHAAQKALTERQETLSFLKTYQPAT